MNLKLFDKSIFKTDIKRFWIASLLYTVLLFFLVAFVYVSRGYFDTTYQIPDEYLRTAFCSNTYPALILGILCGGVFALMLFVYINSTSANSFYHSLPCRRTTLYFTKLISGVVLLVIPVVVNLLVLMSAKASGTFIPAHFNHLFKWAYLQLAYTLLMFFGVSFVAMFTGNFMYLIAISGICVFSPLIIIAFIEGLFSENLYGYVGSFEQYLEWVYLLPEKMFTPRAFIYLILAILFVVFGCILYNKRNLENNGEAVVFKSAKVFFLYLVAVLCGIFSYWYFSNLLVNSILWMLPFGLIGIMGANMINRKQVTLKGFLKPALIYSVAVVLLFAAFLTDITGFERRVPNVDDVAEVNVSVPVIESGYSTYDVDYNYREYYTKSTEKTIANKEDIEKVINLHKYKIENRQKQKEFAYHTNIEYKLKNGQTIKRAYNIFINADANLAEDVFMLEEMKLKRYHNYKDDNLKYLYFTISHDFIPGGDIISFMPGTDEFNELKEALNKDIEEIEFAEDTRLDLNQYGINEMQITVGIEADTSGFVPATDEYAEIHKAYSTERTARIEYRYLLSKGFKRTKALLEKYGFYDNVTKVEQIEGVSLRIYGTTYMEEYVTDRADLEKLYEVALTYDRRKNYDEEHTVDIEFVLYDGNRIGTNIPNRLIEEIINKYL